MTYQEIKHELHKAHDLIAAGDIAGADKTIRAMVGKGLTGADLDANLTREDMRKLRAHSRKGQAHGEPNKASR